MRIKNIFLILISCAYLAAPVVCTAGNPRVQLQTNIGLITLELYKDKAPITVENFLQYVRIGFYDDLLFHRVIDGFMIQGGGYYLTGNFVDKAYSNPPIINESYNNVSNLRGTIAMARTSDPNSATSEFFINQVDNLFLDRQNASDRFGYCVFGKVISDMNVIDAIARAPKYNIGGGLTDFPFPLIIINSAKIITPGCWINSDINNNGIANLNDYARFAANWKKTGSNLAGDININNVVDMVDLRSINIDWLKTTTWYRPIPADIDNSGTVNFKDFSKVFFYWGAPGRIINGDLNNDHRVDNIDMLIIADYWLESIHN